MDTTVLFVIFVITFSCDARPVEESDQKIVSPAQAIDFMKQYGYLPKPTELNTEALYSEDAVISGLMEVQRFAGLPTTGRLDNKTIELLKTPRCGNPDVVAPNVSRRHKRFVIGGEGWRKRKLTWHLANWTNKLWNGSIVATELVRAFNVWSTYSRLEFVHTEDYYNADMVVAFGRYSHGDYFPFDGPGYILAHAYYPYEHGSFGGDIHFDEDENWKSDLVYNDNHNYGGVDFFTVAVHEIGHALGLAHSPVYDSIMYPYYRGSSADFALGYDDILAMYQMYISKPEVIDEDYVTWVISDNTPPTPENTTTITSTVENTTTMPTTTTTTIVYEDYWSNESDSYYDWVYQNDEESTTLTYVGDMAEVDDHIRKMKQGNRDMPLLCGGNFDVITSLRNEIFAFKGKYMWRFMKRGQVREGYPAPFHQMFMGLPENIKKIDAVYERPGDNYLMFFTGTQYWVFDGNRFFSPRPLTDLGLPTNVDHIDAAFVWGKNGRTYFFAQNIYWKYNEDTKTPENGYPQDISRWRGVPHEIDSVFTSTFDGKTYFFSGNQYWLFDDYNVITEQGYPQDIDTYWTQNCH